MPTPRDRRRADGHRRRWQEHQPDPDRRTISDAHFAGSDEGGHTLITIHADDDAPAFTTTDVAQLTASFSEQPDTTGSSSTIDPSPAATGSIDFKDIDLTDRPTVTKVGQDVTWLDGATDLTASLTPDETAALKNALTYQLTGKNNGTVTWHYSIADNALDFLGQDQTAKIVSTITLDDGQGETTTTDVTITITGKNDAPTLNSATLVRRRRQRQRSGWQQDPRSLHDQFHDADTGATFKAIAVTSDAATGRPGRLAIQGWRTAGSMSDSVGDANALVLSSATLIRFVPADGFSGEPGALGVHALDDTYTGAITTAGSTATIDLTATGTGGTTPISHDITTIGTSVTPAIGPVINTESFHVEHNRENSNDIITDLVVTDTNSGAATDIFTVTVSTSHRGSSSVMHIRRRARSTRSTPASQKVPASPTTRQAPAPSSIRSRPQRTRSR